MATTLTTSWQEIAVSQITGNSYLKLYAKYNSQSVANNSSSVSVELRISIGTTYIHCYTHNANFTGEFTDSTSVGSYYHGWENNTETTILSATKNISHDANTGAKSISVGGAFSCSAGVSASISQQTLTLPTIARNFSANPTISIQAIQEEKLTYSWTTSEACKYVELGYKQSNASSYTYLSAVNVSGAKSGTITPGSNFLTPGVTYDFCVRCTINNGSNLTKTSSAVQRATYTYPTVVGISNSSITLPGAPITTGTNPTVVTQVVTVSNPKNYNTVEVHAKVVGSSPVQEWTGTLSGSTITFNMEASVLYAQLGASGKKGSIQYYCVYSSHTTSAITGEFVTTEENCRPYIATGESLSYTNTTSKHITLLGSNQYIIQGKSGIAITGPNFVTVANTSSQIDYYELVWGNSADVIRLDSNSKSYSSINDKSNVEIKMRAVDKRGYKSAFATTTIQMLEYNLPSISIDATRTGNYEDETGEISIIATRSQLMVDGVDKNYWNADSTNHKITYTMNPTDSSLGSGGMINSTASQISTSLSATGLSAQNIYTVSFNINDAITEEDSQFSAITKEIPQAESLFDFNLESPAIGIGTTVNKANIPTGIHAHGLYITDKTNTLNTSQILSSTVDLGNASGVVNVKGYTSNTGTQTISHPVSDKTGSSTVTQLSSNCSEEITNCQVVNGELFIGGPLSNTKNGKIYLYNGSVYVPIIWYQSNS